MTPADSWPVHLQHILAYFLPDTVEYIEPESGVEWADRMTNQTLGHYIPVTGHHDTNNNDGSFRSYFLQIPGTFEQFQAPSLTFEMSHFPILSRDVRLERREESALIVDCTNTNFITTYTGREEGGCVVWWGGKRKTWRMDGGLAGGWLEDGMIRTIGLPAAAIKFSVQTLFHWLLRYFRNNHRQTERADSFSVLI